jgi:hypothetical protein
VGATGAILETEGFYFVAHFCQGSGGTCTGQTGTNHDDFQLSFIGGVYQWHSAFVLGPFGGYIAGWDF